MFVMPAYKHELIGEKFMLIEINLNRFWYLGQQEVYENVDFNNKDDLLKWLDLDYTQVNTAHHLRNKVRTICTLYRNYCTALLIEEHFTE